MHDHQSETAGERYLHFHFFAFGAAVVMWALARFFWPQGWSFFWPMMIWSMVVLTHYLFFKALHIDPEWVDERSQEISLNASDLAHIQSIRETHEMRIAERAQSTSDSTKDKHKDSNQQH